MLKKEAEKMFKIINGKTHKLYSSVVVSKAGKIIWKYILHETFKRNQYDVLAAFQKSDVVLPDKP